MLGKLYAATIEIEIKLAKRFVLKVADLTLTKEESLYFADLMHHRWAENPNITMWVDVAKIARREGFVPAYKYRLAQLYQILRDLLINA